MPTRITDEVRPSTGTFIQQDYSPGYDILVENDRVAEGTRIHVNSNASTGSANLVDIDINNPEMVADLEQKYPLAWPTMYGTSYTPTDESGNKTVLKLVKAVELWIYLNNFETTNLDENLIPQNIPQGSSSRDPYSSYLDNKTPYRVPPETMWNREVFYNEQGVRVDGNGTPIPDIQIDENGSPIFRLYDIGTKEELDVLALSLVIARYNDNLPSTFPEEWFTEDGELSKPITEFTEEELQEVRDAAMLFSPVRNILPYSPFTLQGTRVIASKVAGSYVQKLYSKEYMARTEYETVLTKPSTEHEWGGPYASGKNTF